MKEIVRLALEEMAKEDCGVLRNPLKNIMKIKA